MSYFTTQFKSLCQLRRVAVSAVAAECGVHQSNLSRILHGDRDMTLDSLIRIVHESATFSESDKLSLIRAWLTDQTPEQFRDRVAISTQTTTQAREEETNDLDAALRWIHKSCAEPAFAGWIIQLHQMLTKTAKRKT